MTTTPTLLSTAQAAAELGINAQRVRQLIAAGRLRATLVGGSYVINPADLDAVRHRPNGRPPKRPTA